MVNLTHPWVLVKIKTENQDLALRASVALTPDLDKELISVRTIRDMANDNVVFELELAYRQKWIDVIRANDLVEISICSPPGVPEVVCVGLVDDARHTASVSGGKPARSISVVGRGFNKALANFEIGILTEFGANAAEAYGVVHRTLQGLTPSGSTIDVIIQKLWSDLLLKHENYSFNDGTTYASRARTKLSCRPEAKILYASFYASFQGNLWSLFKDLKSEPFHELFWEVYNGNPTLVLRPTPFNTAEWSTLPSKLISVDVISAYDSGVSDLETYTVYQVQPAGSDLQLTRAVTESVCRPFWDLNYYKKYGLKALVVQSNYNLINSSSDVPGANASLKTLQTDLFNWYIRNNSFYNGSLTIKGDPLMKIGEKIVCEYDGLQYYCESVGHNFITGQSYTTDLNITRGSSPLTRFSSPCTPTPSEYDPGVLVGFNGGMLANSEVRK